MIVFILLMVSEFSAYYQNPDMAKILEEMPPEALEAFSMAGVDLTTPSGFISAAATYFFLLLGFFSGLLGSHIISKEERDKTGEFFYTLPVSRRYAISCKLLVGLIYSSLILLVTYGTTIVSMLSYDLDQTYFKYLGLLAVCTGLIQMMFLGLGLALSSLLKRYRLSGRITSVIIMAMYLMSIVLALNPDIEFLKHVTPYSYFQPNGLLREMVIGRSGVLVSLGAIVVTLCLTYYFYPKRDLNI